jgi:hypothetical protein
MVPLAFGFINTGSVCHLLAVLVAIFLIAAVRSPDSP